MRVVAVENGFELRLADGRGVWPAAIDAPSRISDDPQFGEHARQTLTARLSGTAVLGPPAAALPDRWGRLVAPVFALDPIKAAPVDVAEMIVAAGFARVRPDARVHPCLPTLLQAEQAARDARRGLWADPAYAVLSAGAPATFAGRYGTLQIVEGRVTSVGESGSRAYVNFGPRRGMDFTVVIARKKIKAFDKAGVPLPRLVGRTVRVRGLLDRRRGPQIEIDGPDWLETIEGL